MENIKVVDPFKDNYWDKFFDGFFGVPVGKLYNVEPLIVRFFPSYDLDNNDFGMNVYMPYLVTGNDRHGDRWLIDLFEVGTSPTDWRFIVCKPNEEVLLKYIKGEVPLIDVYETVTEFYLARPDKSDDLTKLLPTELPKHAIPSNDTLYNDNIWFDTMDLKHGYNVVNVERLQLLAENGLFTD